MIRATYSRRAGFTLLEVMIAVALTATVSLVLFVLFDSSVDVAVLARHGDDRSQAISVFDGIVMDDLRSITVSNATSEDFHFSAKEPHADSGAFLEFPSSVSLDTSLPYPNCAVYRVEYKLRTRPDGEGLALVRSERPWCGVKGKWDFVDYVLLDDVESIEAEYYNSKTDQFASVWRSGRKTRLPQAVRFRLTLRDGQGGSEERTLLYNVSGAGL